MCKTKKALAGTLESMDCLVTVSKSKETVKIILEGTSVARFRSSMEETINNVLNSFGIKNIDVYVQDRGALDITLEARVRTAILRLRGIE